MHASFRPDSWPAHLGALARSFEVIAPAHPGYAGSAGADSLHGADDFAFHYADLLEDLGVGPVPVVGCSLGGWLAAELALRHPGAVSRLALIAPLGLHVPGCRVPAFFGAVAPRGVGGFSEARSLLFADPSGAAAVAALPDEMGEDQQLRWFEGLAGAARLGWPAPHFQDRKLTGHLWRVAAPAMLVWGASDRLLPPPLRSRWASGLRGCREATIGGAGHCVAAEQPAAVIDEVTAFLLGRVRM